MGIVRTSTIGRGMPEMASITRPLMPPLIESMSPLMSGRNENASVKRKEWNMLSSQLMD
jgi:hypothetical protein